MTERVVDLRTFVDLGFRPLAEQLAGAGVAEHLIVIDVPGAGLLRIYSPQAPAARAAALEALADKLKSAAAELRKQPAPSVFTPGALKLTAGALKL